jgi:hypothetical protein
MNHAIFNLKNLRDKLYKADKFEKWQRTHILLYLMIELLFENRL